MCLIEQTMNKKQIAFVENPRASFGSVVFKRMISRRNRRICFE
jgi:hypothetical protein